MRFWLFALFPLILFSFANLYATDWREFQPSSGAFKVLFPKTPSHFHNQIPEGNATDRLKCDVYVSANADVTYMMLVADFPKELSQHQEMLSIEGFMQAMLKDQKEEHRLLFANPLHVQGHAGMDFLMKSRQDHFFKGRVMASASKLYLLTVESALEQFQEEDYKIFVNSFVLLP